MEVVRSYDIARLVLGYLRDNKLDKAAKAFCKTSPYLKEELELLRKGFWPVSLRHDELPDIIREYCEIQSTVREFFDTLTERDKEKFPKHGTLLSKVRLLIKVAKGTLEGRTEGLAVGKRKKTISEGTNTSLEATQEKDLPGYTPPISKRRRISESFLCLANHRTKNTDLSSDEESTSIRSPESNSSELDINAPASKTPKIKKLADPAPAEGHASNVETPSKKEIPIPSLPVITEALLVNTEFQNKLVENINKVLTSGPPSSTDTGNLVKKKPVPDQASDEMRTQFEEMIKSILDETEKDPTFSELVENIVLSNSNETKPSTSTQSTQCSLSNTLSMPLTTPLNSKSNEATIKDRLRPRKSNTCYTDEPRENNNDSKLITPCKVADTSELKPGDTSMSLSKFIVLNPNDTMATSTPLISDSMLASSGSQLLNQLGDNIFIDMNTGQSFPFFMANNMNTIFLDASTDTMAGENLQLGKIIDSQNLETMNFIPQEPARIPQIKPPDNPVVTVTIVKNDNAPPEVKGFTPDNVRKINPADLQKSPFQHINPNNPLEVSQKAAAINSKKESKVVDNPDPSTLGKNSATELPGNPPMTAKKDVESAANMCNSAIAPNTITESVDSTSVTREKSTPSLSAICKEMNRSLSTPRRRSSHVRVLTFSTPPESKSETKVSSKQASSSPVVTFTANHPKTSANEAVAPQATTSEPTEITSEPTAINSEPAKIISEPGVIANELSNSSSNNEFAKTTTDVTVIHQSISETPKRKSEGRRSCALVLTQSCSEEDTLSQKPENKPPEQINKSNKKAVRPVRGKQAVKPQKRKPRQVVKPTTPIKCDNPLPANPMEAWNRLRSIPTGQWDQHIREVCAIEEATNPAPPTVRKRRARGKITQKHITKVSPIKASTEGINVDASSSQSVPDSQQSTGKQSAKKALIEFKIATPLKAGKSPGKLKTKLTEVTRDQASESAPTTIDPPTTKPASTSDTQSTVACLKSTTINDKPISTQDLLDSRTHNIGILLDTPYKIDASSIPITPRFLVPDANTTPMIRMTTFQGQISICKNPDVPTPNYAITPGAGLTPMEKDTPRSGHLSNYPTDYSSGSSYYKPDESEELDKRFDIMLAERRRKAKEKSSPKRGLNPPSENVDARENSQEESSNQTVITAINKNEVVLQATESSKVVDNAIHPEKAERQKCSSRISNRSEDRESNSMRRSSSSSSSNSSESNSSSSESDSGSTANSTDDDEDISWVDPESEREEAEKTDEDSKKPRIDSGEARYPTRKPITPKKQTPQKAPNIFRSKIDKKLEVVVDKIKSKGSVRVMRTQQIESLEEKRQRVKDKLKKDFAVLENKRACATPLKKPQSRLPSVLVRNRKAQTILTKQQKEEKKTTQTKIEMLTALNLSERGSEYSRQSKVCSSSPSDIFDGDDFPKLRVDEDSKDSAEAMEVRKAAYVLTKLSKGSIENTHFENITQDVATTINEEVVKVPAKKGRPKKPVSEVEHCKVFPPHKPVTRGDSKMYQKLDNLDVAITSEDSTVRPSNSIDPSDKLLKVDPKASWNDTSTASEKPEPSSDQDDEDEEEEDEDPYEACEMVSVGENDPHRYLCVTYDLPRGGRKLVATGESECKKDLLSSIMNIFINGAPHQIVVADETELYAQLPSPKLAKLPVKKDEKRAAVLPKKRQKSTDTRKGKLDKADESDPAENPAEIRVQPKINIKYKQRAPIKEKGKLKVESVQSTSQKKSNSKHSPEIAAQNTPKPTSEEQTSPETQAPIKNEDIFAVLSLLHGQESEK